MPERVLSPVPEPGDDTGGFLRAWREQHGWTIDQVAWVLRIRLVYLEAIEEDRFEELPGRIYVTGFVRSYARLLGIDDAAVVRHLRSRHPEIDRPRALIFPEPAAERAVPGGALTAVAIMVAVVVYGGWYYQTASLRSERGFDSVPSRLIATADPSIDGFGGAERDTLPAAVPMQPPMRPPPTRTVAAGPTAEVPASPTEASVAVSSIPAPVWPRRAPAPEGSATVVADAPSSAPEVRRGDPPEAGAARAVEVALANAGLPQTEERANAEVSAADGPETGGGDRRPMRSAATRSAGPSGGATERRGMPGPPELPSAEMVDAYAATLPVGMIPAMRERAIERPQGSSSASAAWAGSVDGMSAGQWREARIDGAAASGPVVLNAVEATWIEVREETGQVVTGKLLQAGDSYNVPQRPGLKLTTGNAGGLEILVGGRPAPSVGPRGAVRRDIDLDGRLLLAGEGHSN